MLQQPFAQLLNAALNVLDIVATIHFYQDVNRPGGVLNLSPQSEYTNSSTSEWFISPSERRLHEIRAVQATRDTA